MIRLVAFDWNGTLFADNRAVLDAANEVHKAFGLEPLSMRRMLETTDVPISNFYAANGMPIKKVLENSSTIASIFHPYYENRAKNLRTRQNARTTLAWISNQQIETIIFSNHIEDKIEFQLKRLAIKNYFSTVLANTVMDSSIKTRAKKEKLHSYIKEKKLKPGEVITVGDSPEEIEIAKEIGTISIAIINGNYSTPRLKAAKPDFLIHDLKQIIGIVENLNSPNP